MTKVKVSLAGALVVAGVAVPAWQQTRLQRVQSENAQLRAQKTDSGPQETELDALREEVERLRKADPDAAELERLREYQAKTQPELLRLRGMAGLARRANAEVEQLRAKLAKQPEPGTNPFSGAMAAAMQVAMEQQVEGQLTRMTASLHLTPEQAQAARDILTRKAKVASAGVQQAFSGKFDKAELARIAKEAGDPEAQIKALLTPDQITAYSGYKQEENARTASQSANSELLQLQPLDLSPEQQDRAFAALYEVSLNQLTGNAKATTTNQAEAIQRALEQKAKALEPILTSSQMEKYRQQLALQSKLVSDMLKKMEASGVSK